MLRAFGLASLIGLSGATAAARAGTTFGGDPTLAITSGLSCEGGAPPYFYGASSCLWNWSGTTGADAIPFPATTGGSGTVTSVTLPAMPDPGSMQAVVLTGTLQASNTPSEPNYYCCQVAAISPTFTVPANKVTTVPLELAVSSQPVPNYEDPGETGSLDGMAISVLSPSASLPLLYTGRTTIGDGADRNNAYFPAPAQTDVEYTKPTDPTGYELLAQFNLNTGGTTNPTPTPTPTPTAPAPGGGLKLGTGPVTIRNAAAPLTLGHAQNPPTVSTTQTLTALLNGGVAASTKHHKVVIGRGATTVPAGRTVSLTLTLTSAARKVLRRKHSLKATETIVAKNAAGQTQTTTRTVTILLKRKK